MVVPYLSKPCFCNTCKYLTSRKKVSRDQHSSLFFPQRQRRINKSFTDVRLIPSCFCRRRSRNILLQLAPTKIRIIFDLQLKVRHKKFFNICLGGYPMSTVSMNTLWSFLLNCRAKTPCETTL